MSIAYLDSSAFVKTIIREPESECLLEWLAGRPRRASCALLRTEVVRAVRPSGERAVARAREGLARMSLIRIDAVLLDAAADLPASLRSLDAIHVATAQALGSELAALVTYDVRMAQVAQELGLPVAAP